jgi:hypothetical protein
MSTRGLRRGGEGENTHWQKGREGDSEGAALHELHQLQSLHTRVLKLVHVRSSLFTTRTMTPATASDFGTVRTVRHGERACKRACARPRRSR